jgi:hypothetical protein
MRKFLVSLLAMFFIIGCATTAKNVALFADYFKTYATKTHYITEKFTPDQDYFWVLEEKRNGDQVEVPLVWIDTVNSAIAVGFFDIDTEHLLDYCGIMWFESNEDVFRFLNEFDTGLIQDGQNVPCQQLVAALQGQIESSPIPRGDVANQ